MDYTLDQYYIPFGDHIGEIANEGILFSDKNPKTDLVKTSRSGAVDAIKYKNEYIKVIGEKWAEVFINSFTKTTEGFEKNGIAALKKYIKEIQVGMQFVKSNGDKFREAFNNNNIEVMRNLSEGLRKCFPSLRSANQAHNQGISEFSGSIVEMGSEFKKQLIENLLPFQKIYREISILTAKKYVEGVSSKSKIHRMISNKPLKKYSSMYFLEEEMYAYCRDVHMIIQKALLD